MKPELETAQQSASRDAPVPDLKELVFSRKSHVADKWRIVVTGVLLAGLAGAACLLLPLFQGPVNLSYDLAFLFRPRAVIDDVVIVYMDEDSEARLGQGRWDRWDRAAHARLLERLKEAGAKALVLDILFSPEGTNAVANQQLVEAARAHGKVAVAARVAPRLHENEIVGSDLTKPFESLSAVAVWGMVQSSDASRAVREHFRDTAFQVPSLGWRAAELTASAPPDPFAPRWVNHYGPGGHLPHVRYADVFEPGFELERTFANKVVFVGGAWSLGFSGGKGTDDFRTPFTWWTGRMSPGVEITATTYLNLARGDWLRRLSPPVEMLLVVSLGAIFALAVNRFRPIRAGIVAVLSAACIAATAIASVWLTQFWFPWLIVAGVQIPLALCWSVLVQSQQLRREKQVLEQALVMTRVQAFAPVERNTVLTKAPVRLTSDSASALKIPTGGENAIDSPPPVPDHELIRRIGKGGFGEVWLARNVLGTYHAVKLVFRKAFEDDEPFEREFNGLRRFTPISRTHEGFVHVLHVGRNDAQGYLYYVMELGDDETRGQEILTESYSPKTLATVLRRRGILPLAECLEITLHLANALHHLHQHHLVHCDIKPSNIIFVKDMAKFADIGTVTDDATVQSKSSYVGFGTKFYIAPEGPGTPGADVYSFGKLIYAAAFGIEVGHFPELPRNIVNHAESQSLFALNQIVLKACEGNPRKRFQTAAELRSALAALAAQLACEGKS